jgi:hypothetical protein
MSEWSKIPLAELEALWDECRRTGTVFNGCTRAALEAHYGAENVRHQMDVGWFKRVVLKEHAE